jgi:hypothetical protein
MNVPCSRHGRDEKSTENLVRNQKGRNTLEDLGADGILKWILAL